MRWLLLLTVFLSLAAAQVAQSDSAAAQSGPPPLSPDAYCKFYIGFIYENNRPALVTLHIRSVNVVDSIFSFSYVLNRHNARVSGVGQIRPAQSRIFIDGLAEGRVEMPGDGKLIFESLSRDSLNYWKLKEN